MTPRTTILATALAALTMGATAAERLTLTTDQVQQRLVALPTNGRTLALAEKPAALAERIHALRADAAADPVRREKQLRDAAEALGAMPRSPAAEAALRALAGDAPQVYLLLAEPDHPGQAVPAFDPGAMARYSLGAWVRTEAREATRAAFAGGATSITAAFEVDGEARLVAAGIADAARSADAGTLRRNASVLTGALAEGYPVEDAVTAAAIALQDSALAAQLLRDGDPARTVQQLAPLVAALPPDAAVELMQGIARPELASAALAQLGALSARVPRARSALLAKLADPREGGSAAAALAALHDDALAPTLADMARRAPATPDGTLAAKRAALALFLDGSPAARTALATLADDPRVGAQARAWLGSASALGAAQ